MSNLPSTSPSGRGTVRANLVRGMDLIHVSAEGQAFLAVTFAEARELVEQLQALIVAHDVPRRLTVAERPAPSPLPVTGDIFDGPGPVADAVRAVLEFGAPAGLTVDQISRDQAAGVLRLTGHADRLSARELAAALRRFPVVVASPYGPRDDDHDDRYDGPHDEGAELVDEQDVPAAPAISLDRLGVLRLDLAAAEQLAAPEQDPLGPLPHGAARWARPGEVCTCGAPAVVVYERPDREPVPYCGVTRW